MAQHEINEVLDLQIKILFWLGMWEDESEQDLNFFLKYASPNVASFLSRKPHLYALFTRIRYIFNRVMLCIAFYMILVAHPLSIYFNMHIGKNMLENMYLLNVIGLCLAIINTVYAKPNNWQHFINRMKTMYARESNADENLKKIVGKTNVFCYIFTIATNSIFMAGMCVALPFILIECRRTRTQLVRIWLPYDQTASIPHALTAAVASISGLYMYNLLIIYWTMMLVVILHVIVLFYLLKVRIRNIRQRSINKICNHVDRESQSCSRSLTAISSSSTLEAAETSVTVMSLLLAKDTLPHDVLDANNDNESMSIQSSGDNDETVPNPNQLQSLSVQALNSPPREGSETQFSHTIINIEDESLATLDLGDILKETVSSKELDNEMERELRECVKQHQDLTSFVDDLASALNPVLIYLSLLCIVAAAAAILNLKLTSFLDAKHTLIMSTAVVFYFYFFVLNLFATFITEGNYAVGSAAYESDWLGASTTFKKMMMIIMSRANSPLILKPTGFDPLSLPSFGENAKTSYKMVATMNTFFHKMF